MKKNNKASAFSQETIKRLGLYLRNLKQLKDEGISVISSDKLTAFLNVSPVQFRKDLSCFGGFGKRGVGYQVPRLVEEIERILGLNRQWNIVLVGAGRLGSALLGFGGFSKFNLRIRYAFDADPSKIGAVIGGIKIASVTKLKETLKRSSIKIAILATPPEVAQRSCEALVGAGVSSILNFAPVALRVPDEVSVANVDMACELETLVFFAQQKK